MKEMGDWREYLMERLAAPENAMSYLDVSLEEYQVDGDTPFFLVGLQNVVEAQGGVSIFAKHIGLEPEVLLEQLSSESAPRLDTFIRIVTALGGRLVVVPLEGTDVTADVRAAHYPVPPRDAAGLSLEVPPDSQ